MPTQLPSNLTCNVSLIRGITPLDNGGAVIRAAAPVEACEVCFSKSLDLVPATKELSICNGAGSVQRRIHVCEKCCSPEVSRILGLGIKMGRDERYSASTLEALAKNSEPYIPAS